MKQKGCVLLSTGFSGSGKTTIFDNIYEKLKTNYLIKRLDGDIGRKSYSSDLSFSKKDRLRNHERAASVASFLELEGNIVLCSYIAPYKEAREIFFKICNKVILIYMDCPLEICKTRDPKGIYSQITDGLFKGIPFTGLHEDAPYFPPDNPNLILKTGTETIEYSSNKIVNYLKNQNIIF